jgi:hypothetical protein
LEINLSDPLQFNRVIIVGSILGRRQVGEQIPEESRVLFKIQSWSFEQHILDLLNIMDPGKVPICKMVLEVIH